MKCSITIIEIPEKSVVSGLLGNWQHTIEVLIKKIYIGIAISSFSRHQAKAQD